MLYDWIENVVTFEFTQTEPDCCEDSCCGGCCEDGCCGGCCEDGCCEGHEHHEHEHEEEEEEEDYDDDEMEGMEEELKKLDFDMDLMDQFRKDCNVQLSSEDLLLYLVSMEFISFLYHMYWVLNYNGKKNGRLPTVLLISWLMLLVVLMRNCVFVQTIESGNMD